MSRFRKCPSKSESSRPRSLPCLASAFSSRRAPSASPFITAPASATTWLRAVRPNIESDVLSMFGLTARSQVVALAGAVMNGEAEGALRELNALAKHGKDLGRLLSDLLGHFRNLLIFQVSKEDLKLLEVSETE